jgi:hypothetical protein
MRLGRVVDMFPSRKADILQLALSDPVFFGLSEDLWDAHDSLGRFEALPNPQGRPEIAEYRAIIAELEAEVRRYLASRLP